MKKFEPASQLQRIWGKDSGRDHSCAHTSISVLQGNSEAVAATMAQTAVRMDESALIRAAQAGDQHAFEQLVRQYDRDVLRLALNLLRSQEDAHDIYQEAFLRVFRNLHNFRFDCSFHTWLYRIVTNLCLDALRKRRVRKEETTMVETSDGVLDRMDTVEEPRADGDPQRQLMSRQLDSRIREVLQGLTARERMVFELRHFQGLRLRAIGEMLGTTEEAAKNCLFRATQKMRAALGDFV
jgi:RNA polymerase sigma-70 factor (ECF subfamily)